MSDKPYRFEHYGRRAALWGGIGGGLGFLLVGFLRGDWVVACIGLAFPLPFLALSRVMGVPAGVSIKKGVLRWWCGTDKSSIALSDIAEAVGKEGKCTLITKDGREIALPERALPPVGALLDHLSRRGIPVEWK